MTTSLTTTPSLEDYLEARAAAEEAAVGSADQLTGHGQEAELRRRQLAEHATRRLLAIEREMALVRAQSEAALVDVQAWLEAALAPLRAG